MKQASLLQRIGTYLLGLVDEYWAMRWSMEACFIPSNWQQRRKAATGRGQSMWHNTAWMG